MNDKLTKAIAAVRAALAPVMPASDRIAVIAAIRAELFKLSPQAAQPVDNVVWVPIEQVEANEYNPNAVAAREMTLLYTSILHDGYTQPVVTIYDKARDKYVIVDGFHRYFVCKVKDDIRERTGGRLPVVVIDKSINDRMASTIRHNRARGEHAIGGMSKLVFEMLDNGWGDAEICNQIGLEAEELLKLKHITGFSALFKNLEYSKAWETKRMIKIRLENEKAEREQKGVKANG